MAANPIGTFFSYLHDAFVQNSANNKIVIDRRTIEKTWKYMDKVNSALFSRRSSTSALKTLCFIGCKVVPKP